VTESNRRQRVDSAHGAIQVMQAAAKAVLMPPGHVPLSEIEVMFFNSLIARRAKSEWNDHDLELAALTARDMASVELETRLVRDEGSVLSTSKGSPYQNPRVAVLHGAQARVLAARRSLSIHGRADGERRDVAKRRALALSVEGDNPLEDDLLARPN